MAVLDLTSIRRIVLNAVFSDNALRSQLVLKGGNALELIHNLISRGSVDLDFSIEGDFDDVEVAKRRIFSALEREFENIGYQVFDTQFEVVPTVVGHNSLSWWGGYRIEFKIIQKELFASLESQPKRLRMQATRVDARQGKKLKLDLSKFEYCDGKVEYVDGKNIYFVYTPEMCVFEKLRSICQQMPEYCRVVSRQGNPRARDFYDIFQVVSRLGMDLSLDENKELCAKIFAAKHVPPILLSQIKTTREFHRLDWDSVKDFAKENTFEFDFYFDFVLNESVKLKSLWVK